jgi:cytosine/adenosine deaminase-related metal-dependent hydrolase
VSSYRADWVLPIAAPPLRDGWVTVHAGRVAAVGAGNCPASCRDLGRVALMPGLVNAHTHLELSYLRGQVPGAPNFVEWIRGVMSARRERPDPGSSEILDGVRDGIEEAVETGTVLVGDISNTLVTFGPLTTSGLRGVVFFEVIRFNSPDPSATVADALQQIDTLPASANVRSSLAAHAPYSVAPGVFKAIADAMRARGSAPCSVHVSEGREEVEFIRTGAGPWRSVLDAVGSWDPSWTPPGVSPVQFLDDIGFLAPNVLAVHGVQTTEDDLGRLNAHRSTLVTCPRSNQHTGAGAPPIERFYASGVPVAFGTDSLASTPDLNVFSELAAARRLAPRVPASRLLESATIVGARALGFGEDYGTIEPGKSSRLLAVRVPEGVVDVEEYLVSGIDPSSLFWIAESFVAAT